MRGTDEDVEAIAFSKLPSLAAQSRRFNSLSRSRSIEAEAWVTGLLLFHASPVL